jgi:hypothetical protein
LGDIYSSKESKYGIAEEATYGTAIGDDQAFVQLSCPNFTINQDLKFRPKDHAIGQRMPDISAIDVDVKGAIHSCTIPMQAVKIDLAFFLYMVIQKATEVASPPYQKELILPATADIPDFVANEGLFMTLMKYMPVASVSEKLTSCIARKLELSISADANDGNLFMSAELISAKTAYSRTANPSGTWTKSAQSYFNFHDIVTFTVGGNACILKEWKLTIENNAIPIGGSGGTWANIALPSWNVTNEITIVWDANARTALGAMDSGSEQDIILTWGSTGVDGYLNFECKGVFQSGSPMESEIQDVTLNLYGASDLANTEEILSVSLADNDVKSWPAP